MQQPNPAKPLRVVLGEFQADEGFRQAITEPVELIPAPGIADDQLAPLLADADALISRRFTAAMAANAPRLRLILTPGAGTNEIDFDAVPPGASVCNVYGHETSIAEYVFMTMLALNRDLLNMDRRFRQLDWSDRANGPQSDLAGRTLALVGLGRIGGEIARRARVFGIRVIAATRAPSPERAAALGIERLTGLDDLDGVLEKADIVVVALPLEPATEGLFGAAELARMKPSAFLINVARGPVIDEDALFDALANRRIAGAALDVWYRYPDDKVHGAPSTRPFHELDNVILTPHIAGWTHGTFAHRWAQMNENLRRLAAGEPLLGAVERNQTSIGR
jgi:phosphoglycerate dehydrogenase-like enzyme